MGQKTLKTGIFGGSFNPVHIGHLAIANYLCEYSDLDEVWFVVSPRNPFKEGADLWDDDLRISLVRAAVKYYPRLQVSDVEFHLPRPSYMLHTLEALTKQHPDRRFTLIIGSDNWESFPRWKGAEEILRRFPLYIFPRPGYAIQTETLPEGVQLLDTPLFEISASFIRRAIRDGKDIRFFLHPSSVEMLMELDFSQLKD